MDDVWKVDKKLVGVVLEVDPREHITYASEKCK